MSTTIDIENAKQIRQSMEIHVGISAEDMNATKSVKDIAGVSPDPVGIMDANATTSLVTSSWGVESVADLSGGGFRLDSDVYFADANNDGSTGKYGVQSVPGGGVSLKVLTSAQSVSVTAVGEGTATATYGGSDHTYAITDQFVIPVPANTWVTLKFESTDADERVKIYTVVPGLVLSLDGDDIISCTLDLAGDLSLQEPTFQTSSIEFSAYYPYDISDLIAAISDGTPLWYYAGYPGDYCETRNFYVDDKCTMQDNIMTVHGVDASGKLEEAEAKSRTLDAWRIFGTYQLYTYIASSLENAGITLRHIQDCAMNLNIDPEQVAVIPTQAMQTFLGAVMLLCRDADPDNYRMAYVDAGIPTLYNRHVSGVPPFQPQVWTINEEDCGDVERSYDRNINAVTNSSSGEPVEVMASIVRTVTKNGKTVRRDPVELQKLDVIAGRLYNLTLDEYCTDINISNWRTIYVADADRVSWVADKTGTCVITGLPLVYTAMTKKAKYHGSRPGITISIEPPIKGGHIDWHAFDYTNDLQTNWLRFNASNVTGHFTFKGDPRMQPRHVFDFVRLDGTTERATIEHIEMTHEGGGFTATLYYRLGVV